MGPGALDGVKVPDGLLDISLLFNTVLRSNKCWVARKNHAYDAACGASGTQWDGRAIDNVYAACGASGCQWNPDEAGMNDFCALEVQQTLSSDLQNK